VSIDEARFERLITAIEKQTNALNRLIQVLENKRQKKATGTATRLRRAVTDKPIVTTPAVRAAVERALRRAGHK